MKPKSKFVLITGVSTGIGYGAAKELIRRGYTVFGSVRKKEDADRVQSELGAGFLPLLFDVTDAAAVDRAVTSKSMTDVAGGGWVGSSTTPALVSSDPLSCCPWSR